MEESATKRRPANLPAITRELVFDACSALKAAKEAVTVSNVRRKLGGGSPNTIAPWVKEWHQIEDERFRLSLTEIPEEIQTHATLLAQDMWRAASNKASEQMVDLGRRITDLETGHQRETEEYMQQIDELEEKLTGAEKERDDWKGRFEELERRFKEQQTELDTARIDLARTSQREQEALRSKGMMESAAKIRLEEVATLTKEKSKLEGMLEESTRRMGILETDAKERLDEQRKNFNAEIAKLETANTRMTEEIKSLKAERDKLAVQSQVADQLELIRQDLQLNDKPKSGKKKDDSKS